MKIALLLISMALILTSSVFQPVSDGKILWLIQDTGSGYVLITYSTNPAPYDYIKIVSSNGEEYSLVYQEMLPGKPIDFAISGCNHQITIAATVKDNETVYISQAEIPNNIPCEKNNYIYIPIIAEP